MITYLMGYQNGPQAETQKKGVGSALPGKPGLNVIKLQSVSFNCTT